ncbi:hypothetical protein M3Y98_00118000 [Aphelenchoides besseyi]|nr:hypothetical protein M3Y98_00118000 [Aphelenchoides besseyi]KAI6199478.1 hypothetical protein M3Y96_00631400 [Aphelenchoides besseyi]
MQQATPQSINEHDKVVDQQALACVSKPTVTINNSPSNKGCLSAVVTRGPMTSTSCKIKITRAALAKHLFFLSKSQPTQMLCLRRKVLIREEFEDKFVRLNSVESSDDEEPTNCNDEATKLQRRYLKRTRRSITRRKLHWFRSTVWNAFNHDLQS